MNYLIIYFIVATISAVYTFGTVFAHFQESYPSIAKKSKRQDYGFASKISFLTFIFPIAVIIPICMSGFNEHGWYIKSKY
jgi:hypothetical protein